MRSIRSANDRACQCGAGLFVELADGSEVGGTKLAIPVVCTEVSTATFKWCGMMGLMLVQVAVTVQVVLQIR